MRVLIRRLAQENPEWCAPKIHPELQKQAGLRGLRKERGTIFTPYGAPGRSGQKAVCVVGLELFSVPTATFRVLYCLFVIDHGRRRIQHCNVTRHPSAEWVVQQLREAFPAAVSYRYAILDRDSIFDADVIAFLKVTGLTPKRTSRQSPWQNGAAER